MLLDYIKPITIASEYYEHVVRGVHTNLAYVGLRFKLWYFPIDTVTYKGQGLSFMLPDHKEFINMALE